MVLSLSFSTSFFNKLRVKNKLSLRAMSDLKNDNEYMKWSKTQLVKKILELQGTATETQVQSNTAGVKTAENETTNLKVEKLQKSFDFNKYCKRKIALRFSYLGWNYQGLALQAENTDLPTIEEKIMQALFKVKLIGSLDQKDCDFSRCGRTDRGVSAMNQVISLNVRSKLSEQELQDAENDEKEIDYIKALNQSLPEDIRVHSVCLRLPAEFDARFSCTSRHYKYVFDGKNLGTNAMNIAAKYFLGENDFRNFCKIDASKQITSFKRHIMTSQIDALEGHDGYFVFNLKGSAFLWHQVRCMVAVLLTVGQKLETPEIVQDLLNVEKYPSRPVYKMAHDVPLVLYDCEYSNSNLNWTTGPVRNFEVNKAVSGLLNDYTVKSIMSNFMRNATLEPKARPDKTYVNLGDGIGQAMKKYISYTSRERLDTAETINSKWKGKKKRHHSEI